MRLWIFLLVLLTPESARSRTADSVLVFKSVEARVVSVGDTFAVQYRVFNLGQSCAPTCYQPLSGPTASGPGALVRRRPIFDVSLSDGKWHRNFSRVVGSRSPVAPQPAVCCKRAACRLISDAPSWRCSIAITSSRADRTRHAHLRLVGSRSQRTPPTRRFRPKLTVDQARVSTVCSSQRSQSVARLHRSSDARRHIPSGRGGGDLQG
jgi:hypothetical protein